MTQVHTCVSTSKTQEEIQHRPPESPHPGPGEARVAPPCLGLREDGRRSVGPAQQDGKNEPGEVAETPAQSSPQEGRVGAEGDWVAHWTLQPHQVPRQSRPWVSPKRRVTPPARFRDAPADQSDQRPGGAGRRQGVAWTLCPGFKASVSATAGGQHRDLRGCGTQDCGLRC